MYICTDCHETFHEPAQHEEDYGWNTEYGHIAACQTFDECPYCGSDNIEIAEECSKCGCWFPKEEMEIGVGFTYVCKECYEELDEEDEEE